jgi:hypothetical protein
MFKDYQNTMSIRMNLLNPKCKKETLIDQLPLLK